MVFPESCRAGLRPERFITLRIVRAQALSVLVIQHNPIPRVVKILDCSAAPWFSMMVIDDERNHMCTAFRLC